jgi:hypothetical protein
MEVRAVRHNFERGPHKDIPAKFGSTVSEEKI